MTAVTPLTEFFNKTGIVTETIEHAPVMRVDQMDELDLPVVACKNLFLKDRKKRFWLVSALPDTKINLKALAKKLEAPDLRFAQPELLRQHLGVDPGSVTLFAIINDPDHQVQVVIDKAIYTHDKVGFHPLRNDATTIINTQDIPTFLKQWGGTYQEVDFEDGYL